MNENPNFGFPTDSDVFEEIAKSEQQIEVKAVPRRYGKMTTVVSGFDKSVDLRSLAKSLKEALACGGTVKESTIELQGDHRKSVKQILVKLGFGESSIRE